MSPILAPLAWKSSTQKIFLLGIAYNTQICRQMMYGTPDPWDGVGVAGYVKKKYFARIKWNVRSTWNSHVSNPYTIQ